MKSNTLTSQLGMLAVILVIALGLSNVDSVSAQSLTLAQADGQNVEAAAISQRRALELVRARFPGNVVSINQVRQSGRLQYRVRMDDEGNIYTVYVNAQTGAITREQ
ncbi:MAG: PepSY domain-containing protein [Gammaproteobacteria bacterium]